MADNSRIRGVRSNLVVVDEVAEMDPAVNEVIIAQFNEKPKKPDLPRPERAFVLELRRQLRKKVGVEVSRIPALVFADWLEERGDPRGAALRAAVDDAAVRAAYVEEKRRVMAGLAPVRITARPGPVSLLEGVRRNCLVRAFDVCPTWRAYRFWYLDRRASRSVNRYTRTRMRDDSLRRRLTPPTPIEDEEVQDG